MRLQKQPNNWSCLPTAFAIVLNVDVPVIFKYLGHDGSEIIFPERESPYNRKAFHPQELVEYALEKHNRYVVQFDAEICRQNMYGDIKSSSDVRTLLYYTESNHEKVLAGTDSNGKYHAVACDKYRNTYDPNGTIHSLNFFLDRFSIYSLFLIMP